MDRRKVVVIKNNAARCARERKQLGKIQFYECDIFIVEAIANSIYPENELKYALHFHLCTLMHRTEKKINYERFPELMPALKLQHCINFSSNISHLSH